MIREIALKEFLNNLVSTRFIIGLTLCLVMIPFTMLIGIQDYKSKVRIFQVEKTQSEEADRNVRVWSRLRPEIVKPPEPLSVFCRGISSNVGGRVRIRFGEKTMLSEGQSSLRENPFLNRFFTFDFVTVLSILLSLLALLFTYDTTSREREHGTLRLVFSNPLGRAHMLLGKIFGVFLTLLPTLLICYVISALMIVLSPHISLSGGDWLRVVLLFFMSLIFMTAFVMLGLFISSRIRSSVTSVIVSLFLWVVFVFIIPNMAVYAAQSFVKVQPIENLRYALDDIRNDYWEKRSDFRETLVQPERFSYNWYSTGDDDYQELGFGIKSLLEFHRQLNTYSGPLLIEYSDKRWPFQRSYLDELDNQRKWAETISMISPYGVLHFMASTFCKTNVSAHYQFLESTRRYRLELIDFFKEKKLFSSYLYFTRLPEKYFMSDDEVIAFRTGGKLKSQAELESWRNTHKGSPYIKDIGDIPGVNWWNNPQDGLDLSSVPKFYFQSSTFLGDLGSVVLQIGIVTIVCILLFYLSFISFIHYDVR